MLATLDDNISVILKPDKCYTKSEYARKLNCSPTWINQLIKDKKLTEIKINGGSFVCDLSSVTEQ